MLLLRDWSIGTPVTFSKFTSTINSCADDLNSRLILSMRHNKDANRDVYNQEAMISYDRRRYRQSKRCAKLGRTWISKLAQDFHGLVRVCTCVQILNCFEITRKTSSDREIIRKSISEEAHSTHQPPISPFEPSQVTRSLFGFPAAKTHFVSIDPSLI